MKILLREDFKYEVELACPHDGGAVRKWLAANKIPFVYYSSGTPWDNRMTYAMTDESHTTWFRLRWA